MFLNNIYYLVVVSHTQVCDNDATFGGDSLNSGFDTKITKIVRVGLVRDWWLESTWQD